MVIHLLAVLAMTTITFQTKAQDHSRSDVVSDPFGSQFFYNRYLGNPAMAGLDSTLKLNIAYRKQLTDMPGAPVTQAFSADDYVDKRVGLGLIAYKDKAGLINRTRVALTVAYHVPLGLNNQQLHFGISPVFSQAKLDPNGIIGDQDDPAINEFNANKSAFEVDYGMAYTDEHITLQAALSNMISFMQKYSNTTAEAPTIYVSAAYKFSFDGVVNSIEPQLSILGIRNYKSIVYGGANLIFYNHLLNFFGMVHSTGNFSVGAGLNYKDIVHIQGVYLTQTSGLRNYSDGNYEIDLGISLFRNR